MRPKKRRCVVCKADISHRHHNSTTCSVECRHIVKKGNANRYSRRIHGRSEFKICTICGSHFTPKAAAVTCSIKCRKVKNQGHVKRWKAKNPQLCSKYRKRQLEFYKCDPDWRFKRNNYGREHYIKNADRIKERSRQYALAHPWVAKQSREKYKSANRERIRKDENARNFQKRVAFETLKQFENDHLDCLKIEQSVKSKADKARESKERWWRENSTYARDRYRNNEEEFRKRNRARYAADPSKPLEASRKWRVKISAAEQAIRELEIEAKGLGALFT